MAINCNTGSVSIRNPPASGPNSAEMRFQGNSWSSSASQPAVGLRTQWGITSVSENVSNDGTDSGTSGSWHKNVSSLTADKDYAFQAYIDILGAKYYGVTRNKRTPAELATTQTPSSASVAADAADIDCDYTPNVVDSTCSAQLQYKRTVDSTWLDAGAAQTTGGTSQINIARSLSGLDAETQYDVRLVITRTTQNDTTLTSSTHSFTTLANEPEATTNEATNVNAGVAGVSDDGTATLNGNVDRNTQTDAEWRFAYGTSPGVYTDYTTWTATTSEPQDVQGEITGLTESQTYYFRLEVRWNGGTETTNGSELSFTVPADPLAAAAEEDHVLHYTFTRKYGVAADDVSQRKIRFALPDVASSSSDRFITAASPFATGDVKISKDGGALANTTNLPTQITASLPVYELELTAAELSADDIFISIVDQNGPAFRDVLIEIRTHELYGSAEYDADARTDNKSALYLRGDGSGHGLEAIGGATGNDIDGILGEHVLQKGTIGTGGANPRLSSGEGASTTNDFYNNMLLMIVSGTGAGQCRVIEDYDGTLLEVTPNRAWSTNPGASAVYVIIPGPDVWEMVPGAELSAIPTFDSTYRELQLFKFQRFAYKVEQTATVQTMRKVDDTTALGTRSVSDDGTTQTIGRIT